MKIFPIKIDGVRRWQPLHYMRGLSPQYWFILGVTVLVLAAIAVVTITGVRRVRDTAIAEAIEINTKYVVADEARVRLTVAIVEPTRSVESGCGTESPRVNRRCKRRHSGGFGPSLRKTSDHSECRRS